MLCRLWRRLLVGTWECVRSRRVEGGIGITYPDAACRPRPREPPVTTTTFPLREKMEGKSLSCASAILELKNSLKYTIEFFLDKTIIGSYRKFKRKEESRSK
jgi:hypothetical protein